MADSAVTVVIDLAGRVLSFLEQELNRPQTIIADVERIKKSWTTIQAYLLDACLQDAEGARGTEGNRVLVKQTRDMAHEMEDVLDEFMMHAPREFSRIQFVQRGYQVAHDMKHWWPVREIQSRIQSIPEKMKELLDSHSSLAQTLRNATVSGFDTTGESSATHLAHEEVGIEVAKERLIKQLTDGRMERSIIPVEGLGGSGKTVLVKSVYNSDEVIDYFDCRGWISLSGSFHVDCLLSRLLLQFGNLHGDVSSRLRNFLWGKRYLIVLDDVGSEQHWRMIIQALPYDFSGSKIVVITRKRSVAISCLTDDNSIHEVHGWEWENAWTLFCKKAFRLSHGACPPDLEDVTSRIIAKCDGLPLVIAEVGSLMLTKRQLPAEWEKVLANFGSEILRSEPTRTRIQMMLRTYYRDLSSNLRSCFLSLCVFPEDYVIPRGRLIRTWVAEGFVKEVGNRSLEDVAEDYLNELIGRKLVLAVNRDCDGRVISCQAVNLVREFLVDLSKEESFAAVMPRGAGHSHSSNEKSRRLSIHGASLSLRKIGGMSLACVRSLFMFGFDEVGSNEIHKFLHRFKLLKVLDLEGAPLENFPEAVVEITLLRLLSLRRTKVKLVPSSIKNLHYLEFLDLKHTLVTRLPKEVCCLKKLRYVVVCRQGEDQGSFDDVQGVEMPKGIRGLRHLQKLSLIEANKSPELFEELETLDQLQELGLIDLQKEDGKRLCRCIMKMPKLSVLDIRSRGKDEYLQLDHFPEPYSLPLQYLYLRGLLTCLPSWTLLLHSVVKIHLKWSKLGMNPVEDLAGLPNLMELNMVSAFSGDMMIFGPNSFQKLKILHVERFEELENVLIFERAMPTLEKLTVSNCPKMINLPDGIETLRSLKEFILYDMPVEFTRKLPRDSVEGGKLKDVRMIYSYTRGLCQIFS
ncbi:hypothetical protein Droror1_Dr00014631 [Drosera rotundifolia]